LSRILVTGGSGNLGRLCSAELLATGHDVTIFDRFTPADAPLSWDTDIPICIGDLSDGAAIEDVITEHRPEIIVHLAAQPNPTDHPRLPATASFRAASQLEYPDLPRRGATFVSNVLGTYHLLDCAVRFDVKRIVAASSLCVLGTGFRITDRPFSFRSLPVDESHPLQPEDSYSLSKLLNEECYRAYADAYGITIAALRFPIIFYDGLEERFLKRFESEPRSIPAGAPSNLWVYIDGRDAAHAVRLAVETERLRGFEAFYVATGRTVATSPKQALLRFRPDLARVVDLMEGDEDLLSIDKARRMLGYTPRHPWGAERDSEVAS
jgi:UDP-glucose 4-epimerase